MVARRQCEFFVIRYVPDVVKDEFVNVAVVLYAGEAGSAKAFADVRLTRDWKRVRCLDPDADTDALEALEQMVRARLEEGEAGREWLLKRMDDSFSNTIQVTPVKAVLAESPAAELEKLAEMYLERTRRGQRMASGRQVLIGQMREAFEREGVWPFFQKNIAASEYTHRGDPLRIDCGYRPAAAPGQQGEAVVRMFHAVSLETDVNVAKVLAFSYPRLREGIERVEKARTELTAIIEPELNRDDEGVEFALATMRGNDIRVATVADLGEIAERARRELRL